jgi:hypothetical protein
MHCCPNIDMHKYIILYLMKWMLTQAVLTMYVHVVYMWWWSVRMLHSGKIINSWCKHAHHCPDINVGELGKVYIATGSAVNDYSSVVI